MLWYYILLIVIAATLLAACALLFALALYAHLLVFGKRMNRNVNLKYFEPADFGLTVRRLRANYGKTPLYAAVFTKGEESACRRVVLFCHGIGAGHISYTTEIARLASFGYAVVAYDSVGVGYSQGKNCKGFYANVKSALAVCRAVEEDELLGGKPLTLVGHSWGAYTALCLAPVVNARAVVALSGFNTPARIMSDSAAYAMGPFLALLCRPMWYLINAAVFGPKGNTNAKKCIQRCDTPAFLAYGAKDKTIRPENTPAVTAHGTFIQTAVYDNKGHNVYVTVHAQKLLEDINAAFSRLRDAAKRRAYFERFDFSAATEEDDEVMEAIRFFIDSH